MNSFKKEVIVTTKLAFFQQGMFLKTGCFDTEYSQAIRGGGGWGGFFNFQTPRLKNITGDFVPRFCL